METLQSYISLLEKEGELIRIKEYVNPELEITEITDRFSKEKTGGKALLFENTGTKFPLLINALGSEKRLCLLFQVKNLDELGKNIEDLFKELSKPRNGFLQKLKILPRLGKIASIFPKSKSGKGKCQEVVMSEPDLSQLPILKCWPFDGGRFITFPMVITKDYNTGIRNVGMYRMQVFSQNTTGMHWHKHKVGARHFETWKNAGKKMPVSVALGGNLCNTFSAISPLPDNIDEFILAGFLQQKSVKLVKCLTNDLEVPEDADFILEGYIDIDEELAWEGPFGDHTGFYSLADWYPTFHITCITHKQDAVYPATIVGIPPMEDAWIGKAIERLFLAPMKFALVPEIVDIDMPFEGVVHNIVIISIRKTFAGQAIKVANSLWGAGQMMFNKIIIVVDQNVNVHNYKEVLQTLQTNFHPTNSVHISKGPLDVLDHASQKFSYGGKICIDATKKFKEEEISYQNISIKINIEETLTAISEIKHINIEYLQQDYPIAIIALTANKTKTTKEIATELLKLSTWNSVKIICFADIEIDSNSPSMLFWVIANNIDANRDCFLLSEKPNQTSLVIDGTRKQKNENEFERDWPNAVVSDNETIKKIDNLWEKLDVGKILTSPSKNYTKLIINEGAVVNEVKK